MIWIYTLITLSAITPTLTQQSNKTSSEPRELLNNNTTIFDNATDLSQWSFQDYLKKFNPTYVWEAIQEENTRRGLKNGMIDDLEAILKGIDETNDLLTLKVSNGYPKVVLKDGRRWEPPGDITTYRKDRFSINRRFIELMKQAIYQTRNKMVIMQELREKYGSTSLYKMGFLISKTDQACKTYCRFTFKAFKACKETRLRWSRLSFIELIESYDRSLNLWFEIELLTELVRLNHVNCERMMNEVMTNRKGEWKFVDR